MPSEVLVWWRSALAVIFLYIYCRYQKINLKIKSSKHVPSIIISAIFLGAHWITYFYALKLSNVALGMLSLFTFPVFTALLEPFFVKRKLDPIHLLLGVMVLIGVYQLAPEFEMQSDFFKGILFGLLSALCYALRILILKRHINTYNGTALMLYQLFVLAIILSPFLLIMDTSNIKTQYPYVLLLGLLTTAIGHTLFLKSLKYFSVTTASIIASAQPLFGIILAFLFLKETPSVNTFIGGTLIMLTVIIESLRSNKKS